MLEPVKNLINNQTFLVQETEKGETVAKCMDFYKTKIQSDGSLDKLKLTIENKELVVDNWSPTSSLRTLKYF